MTWFQKLLYSFCASIALVGFMASNVFAAEASLKLFTVAPGKISQTLYFTGRLSPIDNTPVISPTSGIIDKMYVMYGQIIARGAPLFHVHHTKIIDALRDARIAFLKARDNYHKHAHWNDSNEVMTARDSLSKAKRRLLEAKTTYHENQKLYKLNVISKQTLETSRDAYENSISAQAQAARSLQNTLKEGQDEELEITQLNYQMAKSKYESLKAQRAVTTIHSNAAGIVLQPTSNTDQDGESKGKVVVGSKITYQQPLVVIGNMDGLRITFSIPEVNINEMHVGQAAIVTGSAFPGVRLSGEVSEIAAQANSGGGGLPTFEAGVVVKHLSQEAKRVIRSGMNAQIAINTYQDGGHLAIPIVAVHQNKQGQPYVNVYDAENKRSHPVFVKTGKVSINKVQILSGVHPGDQVVLPAS